MIRFATIGTSAIVDRFLEAAALCEGLVHTAVFSRKKETAKAFAKKHGAEFIYTDLKELAESSDIDAVLLQLKKFLILREKRHWRCIKLW